MLRYAITDGTAAMLAPAERLQVTRAWLKRWSDDGVDFVQLREKSLPAGELFELALALRKDIAAIGSPAKLLLNTRADVAVAAAADGVHLTASPGELTPSQVRTVFAAAGRSPAVVSISCHTVADVARAHALAADLILFGPVFGKLVAGKIVVAGTGLESLTDAVRVAGALPVLALGGVTLANTTVCLGAGAAGIAGIRVFQ